MIKLQHSMPDGRCESSMAQPRWGWGHCGDGFPRVVPGTGQPWAGGRNPVGIEGVLGDQAQVCEDAASERGRLATLDVFMSASSPRPATVKMPWGEVAMLAPGRSQRRVRAPGL